MTSLSVCVIYLRDITVGSSLGLSKTLGQGRATPVPSFRASIHETSLQITRQTNACLPAKQ